MSGIEELTLRVAVLSVRIKQLGKQLDSVRAQAAAVYAPHRRGGLRAISPRLPDGTEAGTVSIKAGAVHVHWDEEALFGLVSQCDEVNIEDWVDPEVLKDKAVIDLLREVFPEHVQKRISPARRSELATAVIDSGGELLNTVTGDLVTVAEVLRDDPTGEFAYTAGPKGTAAILRALRDGTITEDGRFAAAAEPAPVMPGPEAWVRGAANGAWADEHGFLDPERAAAHAIVVQGGHSTPPREAYRMIADGGVGAERAARWLVEHGLDPADPAGADAPWPLPAPEPEPVAAGEPGA